MGGMELLARMRAQRAAGGAGGGAGAGAGSGVTIPTPPPDTNAEWVAPKPTNSNRTVSLDVCGGVDCAGACSSLDPSYMRHADHAGGVVRSM